MELEINGTLYEFNFGMRFLRDINKKVEQPIEQGSAIKQKIGLQYYVSLLLDGSVEALSTVLFLANGGLKPNITTSVLDSYFDNPETDIDEIFEKVVEGLETANATKKITVKVKAAIEQKMAQLKD